MILAHDIGTTGNKASLHQDDGKIMSTTTEHYETHYAPGGVVEQNPENWWVAFCKASLRLLAENDVNPSKISVVGVSGQMMGAVLLNSHFEPSRPAIIWADTRSQESCDDLVEKIGAVAAYELLGHQLNPTYSITKVMWVKEHEPEIFAKSVKMCQAKDYIAYKLTDVLVTDPSDASSTNAFNQNTGTWSQLILDAAQIEGSLMPEIVPSTTVIGLITARAARDSGLAQGTPVVIGGGDGPIAAAGLGIVNPSDGAYVYLGSSSWVSMASDNPLLDSPLMRTMTFNHVCSDRFVPTATMQSGGGSLHWIADLLSDKQDRNRFANLVARAETAEASGENLYFLPYLLGERSPIWNPRARGAFIGLSRHHAAEHLTKAVLEGVAFNLAVCLDAFREGGISINQVDAIGGGAASDTWLQILADVWDCKINRRSIVDEANSLGAAVTAGVGIGLISSFNSARSLSDITMQFIPEPDRVQQYRTQRAAFVDAYNCLTPWFDRNAP